MENEKTFGYTYYFVNGEKQEIQVSEEWLSVLKEMDLEEKNNERRQYRNHRRSATDLNSMEYWLSGDYFCIEEQLLGILRHRLIMQCLSERQKEVVLVLAACDGDVSDAAEMLGIGAAAIRKHLKKIQKAISEIYANNFEVVDIQATGRRLRQIRCLSKLPILEICEKLGCKRQEYWLWETGKRPIPEKWRKKLSTVFGIDEKKILVYGRLDQ